ncbi:hypothetical protein [Sphingomonas sp.]|uniref:hypothetical protein n=1 Tax=Sphingomonas sp. TaxID=28214 RepID=UPI0025FE320A|nr:hypothetical protein [Sphingomonas sp.]MBV9526856.1 hypothetical protein [Sphingomonas sp.]
MIKTILALGAAAVAMSSVPAEARHCHAWRHGHCVAWNNGWHRGWHRDRDGAWNVGYRFAPNYAWTDYSTLPQPVVTRYHLNHDWRYVNQNGHIYVVNPHSYRVTRVIAVP